MSDSIRDQLLALGLAKHKPPAPEPKREFPPKRDGKPEPQRGGRPDRQRGARPEQQRGARPDPQRGARPDPQRGTRPDPQRGAQPGGARPAHRHGRPATPGETDLAQAYALRAKVEREAQAQAQREAEQKAREKKERKAKLAALLADKSLNDANADHARHFEHHGKIRRVYVTPEQLARLNRGELGVVQLAGRYLLVAREVAVAAAEIASEALVLLPEPGVDEDGVPADLVW